MTRVLVYDTTLRDGAQCEGVSFSCEDKLDILRRLDSFGADFVEGGWPGSNPRDDEFFSRAASVGLGNAELTAFGSTRRHGVRPEEDANLRSLADCPAKWCCIFGKSWDFQVTCALGISKEDNLAMVEDSVAFLVSRGKRVMFDAEHFFDGYRSDPGYAISVLKAAERGGAEWVVLCDTNGGSLPAFISEACAAAVSAVGVPVGIHCHNDSDLATACSLAAVEAGCTMVQGTVNGMGERCGNANLCAVLPNLALKCGADLGAVDLRSITGLSRFVGEVANMMPSAGMPYVGERAFAHKGGMHVSALVKDPRTYEHLDPAEVGNSRRVLVSDMAGKASISEKLREMGLTAGEDSPEITRMIKDMESEGYEFEGADASFELLVRRLRGDIEERFSVEGFRIFIDSREGGMDSEASVKVRSSAGDMEHTASDGNGPVNALDNALRKALESFFPDLRRIRLTDYKVRVLDEKSATAARVRVLIRSTDGASSWTTVGVSENVIEASLIALVDSLEYALMKTGREA
ncbi:MAG: citramalate synthase [Thermoplasmata archaeon]|nr:citramalate synthase [Thermoplasmata archaeon]